MNKPFPKAGSSATNQHQQPISVDMNTTTLEEKLEKLEVEVDATMNSTVSKKPEDKRCLTCSGSGSMGEDEQDSSGRFPLENTLISVQSEDQDPYESRSITPLSNNSEDIKNENHLMLARIVDTSMWDQQIVPGITQVPLTSALPSSTSKSDNYSESETEPDSDHEPDSQKMKYASKIPTTNSNSVSSLETKPNQNLNQKTTTTKQKKSKSCSNDDTSGSLIETGETDTSNANDVLLNSNLETETEYVIENPMSEPHCMHVIAEWPGTNTDFELLTKLDDEYSANDPFSTSHRVSDIFDPEDWFVRTTLNDDDVPPGCRLRPNPGQFCLTPVDSWTSCKSNLTLPTTTTAKEPKHEH